MRLQELLIEALENRYKADLIVKGLESKIKTISEQSIFDQYKNQIITRNNMKFELIGVSVRFYHFVETISLEKDIDVRLSYVCISKLPKSKLEILKEEKEHYKKEKYLRYRDFKYSIWFDNRYELTLERLLKGQYNLSIE